MAEDDDYIEQFIDKCWGEVDRETRKAANTCMARNAERDSTKPKWARVPQGKDTCPTCLMLASRGFAYNSKEAAEHAHPNCDCVAVCSWDRKNPVLEGYDPDEYYDRWKHPEIYKGLDDVTAKSLACLRVAERNGQVVYEKPLLSFLEREEDRRDLVAHAALVRAGRSFTALAENAPEGYSNIDLLMDGKKWEVKSPHKSNPRAVETRLRAAKDQFEKNYPEPIEEVRVVFNGYFYGQSDEFVASKIAQEGDRHGITEVIHVDKSGKLAETWKARTTSPDRPGLQTGHSIAHAASSTEEHRSPKPTTEVRPLGGVPGESGSERMSRGGNSDMLLHTEADPALDYFGPAEVSHPRELWAMRANLESNGVTINIRQKDSPSIGYGPSSTPGEPGVMNVTEGMSFSAWSHENRHFETDKELGYPGHLAYIDDLELYAKMEREAYDVEIALARESGYNELARKLEIIRDERVRKIERGDIWS